METYKAELNGHVYWHRKLDDEVAIILTADSQVKEGLMRVNRDYPDIVQPAYDEEDADNIREGFIQGEDLEGMSMFFIQRKGICISVYAGTDDLTFTVYGNFRKEDAKDE